jgi:hypothetical protein
MILGNKCDMEDKRQVPRERGEAVSVEAVQQLCAVSEGLCDQPDHQLIIQLFGILQ